jgi:hypothetical protein
MATLNFDLLEKKIIQLGADHNKGNADNSGIHVIGNLPVDLLDKKMTIHGPSAKAA